MTALEKIKEITAFLQKCGIEDAHKESEMILTFCLDMDKTVLYRDNPVLSSEDMKKIDEIAGRRIKREPLQYILGHVEFYGLKIKVGEGVLIPRPETELLAEEVLRTVRSQKSESRSQKDSGLRILDLCTGSGCLALAIAKHLPDAVVYGTDISAIAIKYANGNAELNGIKNVIFLRGSLFDPIKKLFTIHYSLFTVIVSNPPYIKSLDIMNLQPEIKEWEPLNALDGGEDGLKYYREILSVARQYLISPHLEKGGKGGFVILEAGEGQAGDVTKIAQSNMFRKITIRKDYAGIERILSITY